MRQKSKWLLVAALLLVTPLANDAAFAQANIVIHDTSAASRGVARDTIRSLILDVLLQDPRYKDEDIARVDVRFPDSGDATHIVAYVQFRKKYLAEIAVIPLDIPLSMHKSGRHIEINVTPDRAEKILKRTIQKMGAIKSGPCPDPTVDAVFATPVPSIKTALVGVNKACENARVMGLSCKTLIGPAASVEAYQAYLTSCPRLRVFGNIGHGSIHGIFLADDKALTADWFKSLPKDALARTVIYFNSCQVHNDPLMSAIAGAGARTYIGGNVNLLIGPSEEVFKCFWRKVLAQSKRMEPSLKDCERLYYPGVGVGDHGFSGDTDAFKPDYPLPIATPKQAFVQ